MKKILVLVLSVLLLSACSSNSVNKSAYEKKISDLESKISALTTQVATLNTTIKAMKVNYRDGDSYHILTCTFSSKDNKTTCTLPITNLTMTLPGKVADRLEVLANMTNDSFGIYYHYNGNFAEIIRYKAIDKSLMNLNNEYAGATLIMDLDTSRVLVALVKTESTLSDDDKAYFDANKLLTTYTSSAIKFTLKK